MGKFLKIAAIGALSGAAAAYFLNTEKGKVLSTKARRAYEAYQEDPQGHHDVWAQKATDIAEKVKDTAVYYYDQVQSDDFAKVIQDKTQDLQDKAQTVFGQATQRKEDLEQHLTQRKDQMISDVQVDDIIIDLPQAASAEEIE